MTAKRPTPRSSSGARARVLACVLVSLGLAAIAEGCGAENALVDGQCAPGYTACDGLCADLQASAEHCGGCAARCAAGVACVDGVCGGPRDGATGDGATPDGATGDGATGDGATGDSATGDGATGDGATSDGASGDGAAGDACPPPPYVSAANCGACGVVCSAPNGACLIDIDGLAKCAPPCPALLSECGGKCVDLTSDPQNCGVCAKFCPSNLCAGSLCQGATPGDVVVIGHDYESALAGSSQTKVLTNAVFIPSSNPLRVLSYEQFSDPLVVARVKALINGAAGGRAVQFTPRTLPAALTSATLARDFDVVLIPDQQAGSPAELAASGVTWAPALLTFAQAGGVIVALDGASGQEGMPALVTAAQLLDVAGHQPLANGARVGIIAPGDRVATLVVGPYAPFARSASLQVNEPNGGNVVYVATETVGMAPVVVHKVVP
jgi:hypothetical protein